MNIIIDHKQIDALLYLPVRDFICHLKYIYSTNKYLGFRVEGGPIFFLDKDILNSKYLKKDNCYLVHIKSYEKNEILYCSSTKEILGA